MTVSRVVSLLKNQHHGLRQSISLNGTTASTRGRKNYGRLYHSCSQITHQRRRWMTSLNGNDTNNRWNTQLHNSGPIGISLGPRNIRYLSTEPSQGAPIASHDTTPAGSIQIHNHNNKYLAELQQTAKSLLSLRDSKNYEAYFESGKTFNELITDAKRVVTYYTFIKRDSAPRMFPLGNTTATDESSPGPLPHHLDLPGPHLCHSILTTVIIPNITSKHNTTPYRRIGAVIDMCLHTTKSLGNLDTYTASQSQKLSKSNLMSPPMLTLTNANLADEIMRMLCSVKIQEPLDRTNTLIHLYNSTLWVYANFASVQTSPAAAREAALRAEHLLLDLASSQNQTQTQNEDGQTITGSSNVDEHPLLTYIKPDTSSFNTVISAWAKCGPSKNKPNLYKNQDSEGEPHIISTAPAERAEAILQLMEDLYDSSRSSGAHAIQPDERSYNTAIQAWTSCPHIDAPQRAMKILEKMLDRYNAPYDGINPPAFPPLPSHYTFSSVLMGWANSKSPDAIEQSEALFQMLMQLGGSGYVTSKPDTVVFNSLLSVYAKRHILLRQQASQAKSKKEKIDAFRTTIEERSKYCLQMEEIIAKMMKLNGERRPMPGENCEPDGVSHGILMRCWLGLGKDIAKVMNTSDNDAEEKNLEALLCNCIERVDHHGRAIISVDDDAINTRNLSSSDFHDLIALCGSANDPKKADGIFQWFQSSNLKIKSMTYELFIRLLSSEMETIERAREVLYSIDQHQSYAKTNTKMCNFVIDGLLKHSNTLDSVKRADGILMDMVKRYEQTMVDSDQQGLKARTSMYSFEAVLEGYAALYDSTYSRNIQTKCMRRVENIIFTIESIYRKSKSTSVQPKVHVYNLLLDMQAKEIDKVKLKQAQFLTEKSELFLERMDTYNVTPNNLTFRSILATIANGKVENSGQRSLSFLEKVKGHKESIDSDLFNIVLEGLAQERNETSALEAERLLTRMEEGFNSNGIDYKKLPNNESYKTVIGAFAQLGTEGAAKTAEDIFYRQLEYYHGQNEIDHNQDFTLDIKPNAQCLNALISAWVNVGTLKALRHAEKLLTDLTRIPEMESSIDMNSYSSILKGYLDIEGPNAVEDAEAFIWQKDVIRSPQNIPFFISAYCFNLVLRKWGESGKLGDAERSLVLLKDMVNHQAAGCDNFSSGQLRISFNTVMKNFANVQGGDMVHKVEEVFNFMKECDQLLSLPGVSVSPDAVSYSLLMDMWARSSDSAAPRKVRNLLDEFKAIESSQKKPLGIEHYNLVLKACVLVPTSASVDISNNPVAIATEIFGILQSTDESSIKPSHSTYGHMLGVFEKHMNQNDPKRATLLLKLFEKCCNDGYLSEYVLDRLRVNLPRDTFHQCVEKLFKHANKGSQSISDLYDVENFPVEWRRNVKPKVKRKHMNK